MSEAFGIMDQGYFVSRSDIIQWINNTLKLNINRIQQLGTGAIYCQLLDSLYPGRISLNKVNWKAKLEYEFIQNYKLLQSSFDKLAIHKKIDVEKLSKCKYQDNLQMIQWLKRYIQLEGGSEQGYDAQGRRGKIEVDLEFSQKKKINIGNKQNIKNKMQQKLIRNESTKFLKQQPNFSKNFCSNELIFEKSKKFQKPICYTQRSLKKNSYGSITQQQDDRYKLKAIRQILKSPSSKILQIEKIRQIVQNKKIIEQEVEYF